MTWQVHEENLASLPEVEFKPDSELAEEVLGAGLFTIGDAQAWLSKLLEAGVSKKKVKNLK